MRTLLGLACLMTASSVVAQNRFSAEELERFMALGKTYKNKTDYLHGALKNNRIQLASAMAADGISKYVTFFKDRDVVASLVADGNSNLHTVTADELQTIPKTGLLFANVELHARGLIPVNKLNKRYTDGRARLVLQIQDRYIEPVKDGFFPSAPKTGCTQTFYLWSVFGNYRFGVATITPVTGSCEPVGPSKFSLEFAFVVSDEDMKKDAAVILLDGDGHKHSSNVKLSMLN